MSAAAGTFRMFPKAVGVQTVLFRWRGGGGQFFCPACMEREFVEVLDALRLYRG